MRVIIGLIKGLAVGGLVGYGLLRLGFTAAGFIYPACAVVGALVGLVAGRAPWRAETIWTPVLKFLAGALIGVGLAALGLHFAPAFDVPVDFLRTALTSVPLRSAPIFSPIVGILYGIFVEVDDGGGKKSEPKKPADKRPPVDEV